MSLIFFEMSLELSPQEFIFFFVINFLRRETGGWFLTIPCDYGVFCRIS